jgi:hypothetical protein
MTTNTRRSVVEYLPVAQIATALRALWDMAAKKLA